MFEITPAHLVAIVGPAAMTKPGSAMRARQDSIMKNTAEYLNAFGPTFGLDQGVNLARFIGQISVESDYFKTTQEYASGKAYESRTDLGNTAAKDGDGPLYKGHGLIQTTGKSNHAAFTKWAKRTLSGIVKTPIPDFVKEPAKLCEFPWAFFSAVFFWSEGNRTGKTLNNYAQQNNDEMITRIINGGLTHYDKRLEATSRAALVILSYEATKQGIMHFQTDNHIEVDGLIGKVTRDTLHRRLVQHDAEEIMKRNGKNQGTMDEAIDFLVDGDNPLAKGQPLDVPLPKVTNSVTRPIKDAVEEVKDAAEDAAVGAATNIFIRILKLIFRIK
jgi:putative chitinase